MKCLLLAALLVASSWADMPDVEISAIFVRDDADSSGTVSRKELVDSWSSLDTDRNGVVTLQEVKAQAGDTDTEAAVLLRALDYNRNSVVNAQDFNAVFTKMDTNGDGQATILEYAAVMRTMPGEAEVKLLAAGADAVTQWFRDLDTDNNGQLTYTEYKAVTRTMDSNLNGIVTRTEFNYLQNQLQLNTAEGDALFTRYDTNKDGILDVSEESGVFYGMDINRSNTVSETEFIFGTIEPIRDVRVGLAKVGAYYPPILDQLRQIGSEGLGLLFDQRDSNRDAVISVPEEDARFDSLDLDRDGRLGPSQMVPIFVSTFEMRTETARAFFNALDSDSDGYLTKADSRNVTAFGDRNGSGNLDKQEYINLMTALIVLSREVALGKFTLANARQLASGAIGLEVLFNSWDVNRDGRLSNAEFDSEIGARLDLTGDSAVNQLEFMAAWARTFQTTTAEAQLVFYSLDTNQNGQIDSRESQNFYLGFDIDGNGSVDVREFIGQMLIRLAGVKGAAAVQVAGNLYG